MRILTRLQYSGEIYSDRGYNSIPKGELILAGRCVLWHSYFIAAGFLLGSILEKVFWTPPPKLCIIILASVYPLELTLRVIKRVNHHIFPG